MGISSHSGKIYLKYLQRLCGASGVLPASFMLTDGFDNLESRPFTSGGFADVYRATYKGQLVVAKALKTTTVEDLDNVHKVSSLIPGRISQIVYSISSALCEGSCRMEVASAREHLTVRRCYLETAALFDGLGLDGEWEYHEFYQGQSEPESVPPRRYIVCRIVRR